MSDLLDNDSPVTTPMSDAEILFVPLQPAFLNNQIEPTMAGCDMPVVPSHEYTTIMTYMDSHGGFFFAALQSYYDSKRRFQNFLQS